MRDLEAVAHDDGAASDRPAFLQLVRNEQHGHALLVKPGNNPDQVVDFATGERRRGLVHDDQASVRSDRPGNRDELPGRDWQGLHSRGEE